MRTSLSLRTDATDADVVASLRRWLEGRDADVELVQTHISWVLLAGAHAFKIKKPVRLGFLDYSTLAGRRLYCEEEVRLNRRLAPGLYEGVVALHAGPQGVTPSDDGPVVEYAVQMKRLPPNALAGDRLARGLLDSRHLRQLAHRLEAFHRAAAPCPPESDYGCAERVRGDALRVLDGLAECLREPAKLAPLRAWLTTQADMLQHRWAERRVAGRVREGHGDLHLDNVLVLDDEVSAFDCIEFDPALRWIDVMNDIAFLVMDLQAHGRRDLAFGFLDSYLEAGGDFDGLDVLRFYVVYRALVRALVAAMREQARAPATSLPAREYLALAHRLTAPGEPRLLVTHGLPGSGKTQVTRQLLERAGAVRLRSDVERKRMFSRPLRGPGRSALGLSLSAPGPGPSAPGPSPSALAEAAGAPTAAATASGAARAVDLYSPDHHEATYARLLELARGCLQAGYPTIVDAAFLRRSERDAMQNLARELRVPFTIMDCQAPMALLRERVQARFARQDDPSDADVAVLEQLAARREPLSSDEHTCTIEVHADRRLALATLVARWLARPAAV
jgi:hypothetical protein